MSVILQIANFSVSQGWDHKIYLAFTNSGDENINHLFLKIDDSTVFETLETHGPDGQSSCLNAFTTGRLYTYTNASGGGSGTTIPASSTRYIYFIDMHVKADAPIQVNNLVCSWQYVTY